MPSIKDLKKRITTVKNTQQTTRAMKMVSAAKLRRAQEAIQNHRPYARGVDEMVKLLSSEISSEISKGEASAESPAFHYWGRGKEKKDRKLLLVVVTSDRGLCGGFNGNVIKTTQRWLLANGSTYSSVELAFVGRKGHEFFKTKKVNLGPYYTEAGGKVTFAKARKVTEGLVDLYLSEKVDEIKFIYNEFKNAVTQRVVVEDFLPLNSTLNTGEGSPSSGQQGDGSILIVKPSPIALWEALINKHFSVQAFRVLLESQASEHGARMSAMENATKNAGEMIRKLTLQFNKQRQAGITKELLEIISGSESQKASA